MRLEFKFCKCLKSHRLNKNKTKKWNNEIDFQSWLLMKTEKFAFFLSRHIYMVSTAFNSFMKINRFQIFVDQSSPIQGNKRLCTLSPNMFMLKCEILTEEIDSDRCDLVNKISSSSSLYPKVAQLYGIWKWNIK